MKLSSSVFYESRLAPPLLVLVGAAIAVVAYLQAFNYPFNFDDAIHVTENTKLAELRLGELWRLLVEPYNRYSEFLPLRDLSFWFDITLFGLNPSAFRMHNILLYLLCLPVTYGTTLSLWCYFRPADAASAPWAAAAVTALFAVHPVLVESVVWVSGRKYALPNLFSMLTLWFAVKVKREQGFSPRYAAAALVAFVAVMLSKASYFTVAPVVALLWVMFWRDIPIPNRRRSLLLWPAAILLLAAFLLLIFIASSRVADSSERVPLYFGIEVIPRTLAVLGWLARLAVSPEGRHFIYPVFEDPWFPAMVAAGVAVLASAAWGMVMLLRRRSLEGFALAAFALLCIPYLQLIPYGAPSLVSDRYLAFAAWSAILLLVALVWRLKPAPRTILLFIIALPLACQTAVRTRDWRSFDALVDADLHAFPGHYAPAFQKVLWVQLQSGLNRSAAETARNVTDLQARSIMMGLIHADYAVRVKSALSGNPQEAMGLLLKLGDALKKPPVQAKWNANMLHVYRISQRALHRQWIYLAERFPDDALVHYNTGLWMLGIHKDEYALGYLRTAVESQHLPAPVRGAAFKSLGLALINSGHVAEAEAPLRAALAQQPPDTYASCLLSEVYKQTRRFEEAARAGANCPKFLPTE